jgi:RNA polymerase sigma-70 factor, ECF subfamily
MSVSFSRVDRLSLAAASAPSSGRTRLDDEVIVLFDRYRASLLQYMASFGLGFHDGEEIIQEVFLLLLKHLEQGKSRENLPGWIFRVAHNLALKQKGVARRDSGAWAEADAAVDQGASPERALIEDQAQTHIQSVVEALGEQDRRCLLLRAEGLRYREIAEVLGISLGSVSTSLTRSLVRIARTAERYGNP